MADVDSLFDFLHMEIVASFHSKCGKFMEVSSRDFTMLCLHKGISKRDTDQYSFKDGAVQKLERMGFNVGQRLVERYPFVFVMYLSNYFIVYG